jgi:hypothetical protein
MAFRLKDQLGKGTWHAIRHDQPRVIFAGCDSVWFKKDATLDELCEAAKGYLFGDEKLPDGFRYEECVKEGRKIVRRTTKTYMTIPKTLYDMAECGRFKENWNEDCDKRYQECKQPGTGN